MKNNNKTVKENNEKRLVSNLSKKKWISPKLRVRRLTFSC